MLEDLKEQVCDANKSLVRHDLVIAAFGNVSGLDREKGLVVIKPAGVSYEEMEPSHMVVVELESGKVVEGDLQPSPDTPTHLVLYRAFEGTGGIAHTHSAWATAWAQAGREIPCLGTTHADHFYGPIPCTDPLRREAVKGDYEEETGKAVVARFRELDPAVMPVVLVSHHGPFAWGRDPREAVYNAVVLEEVARTAALTVSLNPGAEPLPGVLLDKHFFRNRESGGK